MRYQNCRGWKFHLGRYQLEMWLCPQGERIPLHRHPHIDSYVLALAGGMRWTVNGITRSVCGPLRLRTNGRIAIAGHRLTPNDYHGATVTGNFGLFLVLERWQVKPTSAAIDIEYQQ